MTLYASLFMLHADCDSDIVHRPIHETEEGLLAKYKERNPILRDVLAGETSVSDTLRELDAVRSMVPRWLPRRENPAHNERVRYLAELIEPVDHLYMPGVFSMDNPLTAAAYGLIGTAGAALLVDRGAALVVGVGVTSWIASSKYAARSRQSPFDQAQRFDVLLKKIKEDKI